MSEPVIALRGVVKDFGTEVVTRVLHGVDMTVHAGEFAALMGPSGSGKSTLLNILGLLDRPTAGAVEVTGRETTGLSDQGRTRLRADAIGFVFQFHHLISALTAVQNVMLPLSIDTGWTRADLRERAVVGLEEVGLGDRADEMITKLSGGQQQRVAVARALVRRPPLLLADEPTGNLDTETADEVFRLMRRKSREHDIACLFVTHDPRLAERCDRIFTLVDGRIVDERSGRSRDDDTVEV
jgi:lipoprotein-releasing system ATP-binding protein